MMHKPINRVAVGRSNIQESGDTGNKLLLLRDLLAANRSAQHRLRDLIEATSSHFKAIRLSEEIAEYQLKLDHPPHATLHKFLQTCKQVPKVVKQQESIKNTTKEDLEIGFIHDRRNKHIKKHTKIELPAHPTREDFIKLASQNSQDRKNVSGMEEYRQWLKKQPKPPKTKVLFQEAEVKKIIELQKKYGENWQKICQRFQDRTFEELYYEYHNHLFSSQYPKDKRLRWTIHESLKLIVLMEHYGQRRWSDIAKKLKTRSQLQVRERFVNILDPDICNDRLDEEEVQKLVRAAHKFKYRWKLIKNQVEFKGKTDNALWRCFRNVMVKKTEQEIREEVKEKKLAEKLIKIKKNIERDRLMKRKSPIVQEAASVFAEEEDLAFLEFP